MPATERSHGDRVLELAILFFFPLWFVHAAGGVWVSYWLFVWSGGVTEHGEWTSYGGIDYAWTNVAWVPAG